jgi:hypothetical protein
MLNETFKSIAAAARSVFKNWRSMLLIAIVYAVLLAVLYFFVVTREATFVQVTLTFASAIIAPLLFFVLQAMIASEAGDESAASLLRKSLTSFWKLILVTLPLIALAILIIYLLGKAQVRIDANVRDAAAALPRRVSSLANAREAAQPIDWKAALLSTLRYLTFGLFLPLAAIHLWLATAREGLGTAIKKLTTLLARIFDPQSILAYIVGFLVFAVIPYFLLFNTVSSTRPWLEISLLVARLAIVFALTLFGWVMTVKAISLLSASDSLPTSQPDPAAEAV